VDEVSDTWKGLCPMLKVAPSPSMPLSLSLSVTIQSFRVTLFEYDNQSMRVGWVLDVEVVNAGGLVTTSQDQDRPCPNKLQQFVRHGHTGKSQGLRSRGPILSTSGANEKPCCHSSEMTRRQQVHQHHLSAPSV
jgi:hypothetical protein